MCKAVKTKHVSKVGLFGTKFTMAGNFYQAVAEKYGIEIILPENLQQEYIHDKHIHELVPNIINKKLKIN